MAETRVIFLGWQLPAGLYTTDGAENKAGMRRVMAELPRMAARVTATPGARMAHMPLLRL
jgi:hypothetical protein